MTQSTVLRGAADGTYSAIENVDVTDMLACMQAISLRNDRLRTLDGFQFCTNLRALDVCFRFRVARVRWCRSWRRCSSIGGNDIWPF